MNVLKILLIVAPFIMAACSGAPASQPVPTQPSIPTLQPTVDATATLIPPTSTQEPTPTSTAAPTQAPNKTPVLSPTTQATPMPTSTPLPPTSTPEPTATHTPVADISLLIQEGSTARFIVEEQLANLDLPNDVIGETRDVSGAITFDANGVLKPEQSIITVNVQTLKTDSDRRDGYLRENSLESNSFPTTHVEALDAAGLPWPLPTEGEATFQMVGDMTVRDQTRSTTWDVTAQFNGDSITGSASTEITFEGFGMEKPSVFIVLSVEDEIRVELDFAASVTTVE